MPAGRPSDARARVPHFLSFPLIDGKPSHLSLRARNLADPDAHLRLGPLRVGYVLRVLRRARETRRRRGSGRHLLQGAAWPAGIPHRSSSGRPPETRPESVPEVADCLGGMGDLAVGVALEIILAERLQKGEIAIPARCAASRSSGRAREFGNMAQQFGAHRRFEGGLCPAVGEMNDPTINRLASAFVEAAGTASIQQRSASRRPRRP